MNKLWLKMILKIIIASALLTWFLLKSDLRKIFENISDLSFVFLLEALILNLLYLLIKTWRWRLLLPQFSTVKLLQLNFISQFYSIFSAGIFIGEAAKVYIIGKGKKDAGQIAMSVIIDKITGTIGLVAVAIFGLIFTELALPRSLVLTFTAAAILFLIMIFFIRLRLVYKFLDQILKNRFARADKSKRFIGWIVRLFEAWHFYAKKMRIIFYSIILGIVFQLVLINVYMELGRGLGIDISFFDWCWILGILSGLLVLPITIGGIGVREGSLVGLLGLFSIAPEKALALSFSVFGVQLILAAIGGIIEARRTEIFKIKALNDNQLA